MLLGQVKDTFNSYQTFYQRFLGCGPLQWVFLAELLPPEYKVLSAVITSITTLAVFIITKMYPFMLQLVGPHGTYWLFGAIAMASNFFLHFLVPETKGKSFLEMQQFFKT